MPLHAHVSVRVQAGRLPEASMLVRGPAMPCWRRMSQKEREWSAKKLSSASATSCTHTFTVESIGASDQG